MSQYKKVKDGIVKMTGRACSRWPYFEIIDKVQRHNTVQYFQLPIDDSIMYVWYIIGTQQLVGILFSGG